MGVGAVGALQVPDLGVLWSAVPSTRPSRARGVDAECDGRVDEDSASKVDWEGCTPVPRPVAGSQPHLLAACGGAGAGAGAGGDPFLDPFTDAFDEDVLFGEEGGLLEFLGPQGAAALLALLPPDGAAGGLFG